MLLNRIKKSSFLTVLADNLVIIGLIGIFYAGWGRSVAWLLFFVSLLYLPRLEIHWRLFLNSALFVLALGVGAFFSANPEASLSGCLKIFLGLCMFVPGVFLGWRLRHGYISIGALFLVLVFGLIHFAFPVMYGDHLVFGFYENPNIIGRGLTFGLLLLGVVAMSSWGSAFDGVDKQKRLYDLFLCVDFCVLGVLLIFANYRSGWLGLFVFTIMLIAFSRSLAIRLRIGLLGAVSAFLLTLVAFRDWKGFGYGNVGERLDLWTRSLAGWAYHFPVFGSGFRSFHLMPHLYLYGDVVNTYRYPHNVAVEFIFSAGLYGLICLGAYIFSQWRFFAFSGSQFASPVSMASIVAALSILVVGQFEMELASFSYIGALAAFAGVLYAQRPDTAVLRVSNPVQKVSD